MANRRHFISHGFLTTDAMFRILLNTSAGPVVCPTVISETFTEQHLFLPMEAILMATAHARGDLHHLNEDVRRSPPAVALTKPLLFLWSSGSSTCLFCS